MCNCTFYCTVYTLGSDQSYVKISESRLGQVADRFGERVSQPPGDLGFILDNNLGR